MTTFDPSIAGKGTVDSAALPVITARAARIISSLASCRVGRAAGDIAAGCIVVLAFALMHCDGGIQGDAHIYLGRALADLDPSGVGRDIMFVYDGQSAYTAFSVLTRFGVAYFGLAITAKLLGTAAAVVWAAAMLLVITTLRPGRHLSIVVATSLLLPRWYTPWQGLGAGEAAAIPRPFAEAVVLVALAMLTRGRPLTCGLLLCGAAALHPIMAAPGFAVLLYMLIWKDRRWAIGALGFLAVVLSASMLDAPICDRLFVAIDPVWLSILRERSPYLFVTRWPTDALAIIALQMMTILIASTLIRAPFAILFRAVVVVSLLGGLASAVGCDTLHLLLFAQAQLWRSFWLGATVAPLAAGVCLWRLPSLQTRGCLALSCLVAAWACFQLQPLGAGFATVAAVLVIGKDIHFGEKTRLAIYAVATTITILAIIVNIEAASVPGRDAPAGSLTFIWHLTIWPAIVTAFLLYAKRNRSVWSAYVFALLLVPALLAVLIYQYDDRSALKADRDAGRLDTHLTALLASRPGDVLWLGGDELWYWTRRPNWSASIQGAGLVFSRTLALIWQDRASALVDHGFASRQYLNPWAEGVVHRPFSYDKTQIDDFCRRSDAPAWIILPVTLAEPVAVAADVRVWTTQIESQPLERRLVIPCRPTPITNSPSRNSGSDEQPKLEPPVSKSL